MPEILRPGVRKERIYDLTCDNCGCVARFKEIEGKLTYDQRDGDYYTFKCPECGTKANVDAKLIKEVPIKKPEADRNRGWQSLPGSFKGSGDSFSSHTDTE